MNWNRNSRLERAAGGLAAAALVIMIGWTGCGRDASGGMAPAGARGAQAAAPVRAGVVETREVPIDIHAVGNVEAYRTVSIRSLVAGALSRIAFREGDFVQEGQLLFEIDPRPFEADMKRAQASLEKNRAQLKNAETQLKRYEDLVEKDFVTKAQYDEVKTSVDVLRSSVKADEQAVENARLQLEHAGIRAPISGKTGALAFHQGDVIKANDSVALVTINQIQPVLAAFTVPGNQFPEIRRSMDTEKELMVNARPSGSTGESIPGKLEFVDNTIDQTTGMILLKARFDNADQALWPGQFVEIALTIGTLDDALVVPSAAVQIGQEGSFVFVIREDSTVEKKVVTVSRTVNGFTVVENSLKAGDRIVTEGQLRLVDGSKVDVL